MNREIKFRAYDGTRWFYFDNHEWTLDFNDISGWNVVKNLPLEELKGRKWDAGESSEKAETFVLMQFTGLKDKNGKEIYEGDQLFITAGYSSVVKFEDGMFVSVYSHPEDGETIPLIDAIGKDTEVIGNIYENI